MFLSRTLSDKTEITGFFGRPDSWGIAVRTITACSKKSTCMATFSNKIAAAYDDGTVGIYDSVTGVPRLSLSFENPVQVIKGSPDGFMLFCAHKTPSVTVWDMQTGGLIHTFDVEPGAKDIDVSLDGRYLACGLFDGAIEVFGIANKMEGAAIWTSSPVTFFCWLRPEQQLAASTGDLVGIWDVLAGTLLRSFKAEYPVRRMTYSQKFNRLAIMATSSSRSEVTIINPQTVATTSPHLVHDKLTCFAFSQTTEELVCGMETYGLRLFNVSTRSSRHFEHPDIMASVSCLQNGTVVANFAVLGVQLLSLHQGHTPSQQPTTPVFMVQVFDEGRIIAIFPTSRDQIVLLEPATMSGLLKIPVRNSYLTPADRPTVLCVSCENLLAVCYVREKNRGFLQWWGFYQKTPAWTAEVDGVPEIGRISPTAARLVTVHARGHLSRICVWNAKNGKLDAQLEDISLPLDIRFTSDTEFYSQYDKHRVPHTVHPWGQGISSEEASLPSPPEKLRKERDLEVDDTHEWVVRGSKRICWIPPGYIGSIKNSYCWAGSSLVMVGRDEMLRKIIFS